MLRVVFMIQPYIHDHRSYWSKPKPSLLGICMEGGGHIALLFASKKLHFYAGHRKLPCSSSVSRPPQFRSAHPFSLSFLCQNAELPICNSLYMGTTKCLTGKLLLFCVKSLQTSGESAASLWHLLPICSEDISHNYLILYPQFYGFLNVVVGCLVPLDMYLVIDHIPLLLTVFMCTIICAFSSLKYEILILHTE